MRYSHKLNGRMNESDRLIINLLIKPIYIDKLVNQNTIPPKDPANVKGRVILMLKNAFLMCIYVWVINERTLYGASISITI